MTRIQALRERLSAAGADAMVVTDLVNVRYLTGFTGSNAALGVTADDVFLVTDGRYTDQAAAEAPGLRVVGGRAAPAAAVRELGAAGTIAIEAAHVSLATFDDLRAHSPATLEPVLGLVEGLRRCKDAQEVALLRQACTVISDVMVQLADSVRAGQTEREVAQRLYWLVQEAGADDIAFETIVASGPNSAIPHHTPTGRVLAPGDLLKIDAGALVGGYHSDITRMFVVGADPTDEQRRLFDAVAAAAAAARDRAVAGTAVAVADEAARTELARHALADRFTHGLGHGVGLQIHEAPMVGRDLPDTMAAGDVLTIEPGAYLPGFGGVRIEDTLAIGSDGTECLTTAPRELISLG